MKKKVNYKDISKKTGISIGTISRYFNNGPVSNQKKKIIKKAVSRFGYVRNANASNIKGQKNLTIVLRPFDNISAHNYVLEGILEHSKNELIVKYYKDSQNSFEKTFMWSLSQMPLKIIIFAPLWMHNKLEYKFWRFNKNCEIVFFNYKSTKFNSVTISFNNIISKLSSKYSQINMILNESVPSIHKKDFIMNAKKVLKVLEIENDVPSGKRNNVNIFQTRELFNYLRETYKRAINKGNNIIFGYKSLGPNMSSIKLIFIDYYFIGVKLVDMRNESLVLDAVIIAE